MRRNDFLCFTLSKSNYSSGEILDNQEYQEKFSFLFLNIHLSWAIWALTGPIGTNQGTLTNVNTSEHGLSFSPRMGFHKIFELKVKLYCRNLHLTGENVPNLFHTSRFTSLDTIILVFDNEFGQN
jgi:hypothetical protein